MSSVVTSLYGIDIFRRALYSATSLNASSVMLSQVFAKIQMASAPVHTQFCLIPAFEADLEWKFGQFECILDFGTKLLDSLPESVTNLFKLNVRCSQITKSDDKSLKFEDNFESHLIISPRFGSVSAAIYSRFLDSQADNFVITKDDWKYYSEIIPEFEEEKIYVPMYTEMNILNRPEILIFGIRRLTTYPSIDFDISEMILDFEFDMPSEDNEALPVKYFLQAFCYHAPGHYISYVRDFKSETIGGDWYMYNDLKVTSVRTKGDYAKLRRLADTSATLAFYVRADSIVKNEDGVVTEEIQIPERIATIANLMISLENTEEKKLKMESAKALSLTNLAKPIFSSKKRSNFLPVTSNSSSYVSPFSIFKDDVMKCTSSLLEFTKWFPLNSNYSDENI